MKRQSAIALILAVVCGTFYARGDCNVQQVCQLSGIIAGVNPYASPLFNGAECALDAPTDFQCLYTNSAFSGGYAYSEVDHEVILEPPGGVVVTNVLIYDACCVSGNAFEDESFWKPGDYYGDIVSASSSAEADEDLSIQWNSTDAPPTSIKLQGVYLVQGQISSDYGAGIGASGTVSVDGGASVVNFPNGGLEPPAASFTFSTNVLGAAVTCPVNALTSRDLELQVTVSWGDPVFIMTNLMTGDGYKESYTSSSWYAASCYFEGYTNIVDESNQPVDPGKLIFRYVNPKDPTNVGYTVPPYPIPPTAPSLQVLIGPVGPASPSSGLALQWPLYASDYQLQMTANVASGVWSTSSLPAPVQVGSFLQVTIPATNSCAFFRLVQRN